MDASKMYIAMYKMLNENYKEFIKALMAIEFNASPTDPRLDQIAEEYLDDDDWTMLHDKFFQSAEEKGLV